MTTSEPTTGEIAGAIRVCENKLECDVCPMRDKPCGDLYTLAADRLESQERKIADIENFHKEMLKDHKAHVVALTARAEQSERERDAAVAEFDVIAQDGLCEVCFFGDFSEVSKDTCMEDCCFQWRNKKRWFAQEGDGK